jgi:hypothetical protein
LASAFASFFAVSFSSSACPSRLSVPILACNASGWSQSDLDDPSPSRVDHLPSSIGRRGRTVRPSATPCTWRTEDRTRSTRGGMCILTMFRDSVDRRMGWFEPTFAVEDVDRWDRLGSVCRRLFWSGASCGGWGRLVSFLVWCHRERSWRRAMDQSRRSHRRRSGPGASMAGDIPWPRAQ